MKKIILLSLLVIIGMLGISQLVHADNATLSFTPASTNNTAGTSFNVSVKLDPKNNKVCVAEGKINFSNLTCQSITLASGIMAQTTPTCADSSFVIGIPKCTTVAENIISISVKGTKAGQASLSLMGTKIIGAGIDIASTAQSGAYNITAIAPLSVRAIPNVAQPITPSQEITNPVQQTTPVSNVQASASGQQASLASALSPTTIIIIVIILLLAGGLWYLSRKKDKKDNEKPAQG